MPGIDSVARYEAVARKIVNLTKAQLLADNHFLAPAIGKLDMRLGSFACPFATNGAFLGVDARLLCALFARTQVVPIHDFAHVLMHCLFLHPFIGATVDRRLWNLSADIAAERNVADICGSRAGERGQGIAHAFGVVEACVGHRLTSERLYNRFCEGKWAGHVEEWERLFTSDDHVPWYPDSSTDSSDASGDGSEERYSAAQESDVPVSSSHSMVSASDSATHEGAASSSSADAVDAFGHEPSRYEGSGISKRFDKSHSDSEIDGACIDGSRSIGVSEDRCEHDEMPARGQGYGAGHQTVLVTSHHTGAALRPLTPLNSQAAKAASEGWRKVSCMLSVDLRTYSRNRGKPLGGLAEQLEENAHERVDYLEFLRQFAIPGEVLKVSEDEFDYVYYTYGLSLYGNLPLIEPLEYREEKRIREFVIVIDTSGSVWGKAVQRFIDTTFDILKSTEAFFEKVHVHLIQCDAAVQSDDVITNMRELKEWERSMRLHGCGGTDFRPAFNYVDGLIEKGEFENLGGLIYFTDGWGIYPKWMPDYKTAFVFYDEDYRKEIVPPWAVQIVLDDDAIMGTGVHQGAW